MSKLNFYYAEGSYFGNCIKINLLKNGVLECWNSRTYHYPDDEKIEILPTKDSIEALKKFIVTCNWKSRYEQASVMDGTDWQLEAE